MAHVAERQFWAACVATKNKIASHVQTLKAKNGGEMIWQKFVCVHKPTSQKNEWWCTHLNAKAGQSLLYILLKEIAQI